MQIFLYRILPICLLGFPYLFYAFLDGAPFYFNKESGMVENITVVLLGIALFISAQSFLRISSGRTLVAFQKESVVWLALYCLGCLYFLGEEISWGQHLFDWSTPEAWTSVNDQQETNLHNTYAIFDQIPRALMTLGIVIFGFIYPLTRRNSENSIEQLRASGTYSLDVHFLPGSQCVISAATILFISIHDKLYKLFGSEIPSIIDINDGEVKESLIALFILIYICDARQRWNK